MRQEDEYNVIDSKDDFNGWELLWVEQWKPGVKRVFMRKINPNGQATFMTVFSRDEHLEGLPVRENSIPRSGNA